MLLNELFEAKITSRIGSIPVVSSDKPLDFKTTKMRFLDSGIQSNVFTKGDTVIKVTALKGQNDPVIHYMDICLHNSHNPYLPNVKSAKIYQSPNALTLVTAMEHLDHINMTDVNRFITVVNRIRLSPLGEKEIQRLHANPDQIKAFRKTFGTTTNKHYKKALAAFALLINQHSSENVDLAGPEHMFDDKELLEAIRLLKQFQSRDIDLHAGNMMIRGEHQLVITDPVFGRA